MFGACNFSNKNFAMQESHSWGVNYPICQVQKKRFLLGKFKIISK